MQLGFEIVMQLAKTIKLPFIVSKDNGWSKESELGYQIVTQPANTGE